ncbi:aminoacyl-tRNA hydrolase [Brackiella oedipodis]|uniref:aminoacyl-tRNA hydrolase n=1 Tax=Brackiella oedipodis TaxID=124225 RepID=UPI00048D29D6|nr:aminoacyl-tRNA hydrolase [Brackiella oedipodis]
MAQQASAIRLIVGLGNPGAEYELTRHNAGFWMADHIAQGFNSAFKLESSFFGEIAKARYLGQPVYILKPATFMNRSGQSVQAVAKFFKIAPEEILIIHDEMDLLPGQVKLKKGGGHAGHNGLRDIDKALGTPNYWRLRLGIGHPRSLNLQQPVVQFVLHRPSQTEMNAIEPVLLSCQTVITPLLEGDIDKANRQLASICKKEA